MHKPVTAYITCGQIGKTYGKQGEVIVRMRDNLPFCLYRGLHVCLTPPELASDPWTHVIKVRKHGTDTLVVFEGKESLQAARELEGKLILAAREDVPELIAALAERERVDAAYAAIKGIQIVDSAGMLIGIVRDVEVYPGSELLVVEHEAEPGLECERESVRDGCADADKRQSAQVRVPVVPEFWLGASSVVELVALQDDGCLVAEIPEGLLDV